MTQRSSIALFLFVFATFLFAADVKHKEVDNLNAEAPSFAGYAEGKIVVKFSTDMMDRIRQSASAAQGVTGIAALDDLNKRFAVDRLLQKYPNLKPRVYQGRTINPGQWYSVTFKANENVEDVVRAYKRLKGVVDAQPVGIHRTYADINDPSYSDQWHLSQSNDADIDAPEAWDIETGSDNIIVAILDTGVRYFHKDLGGSNASYSNPEGADGNMWINEAEKNGVDGVDDDGNGYVDDWIGWDFVDGVTGFGDEDDTTPDNDPRDFNGHGTHCSGITSAINNNGYAVGGVAGGRLSGSQAVAGNGVDIMAMRIGYSGRLFIFEVGYVQMDFAADAFYYAADNGAHIASCSWGSSNSGGLGDALDYFIAGGGMVFKAAGNDDDEGSDYMLDREDVIGVASTDQNDVKSDFSTYGDFVDISAPGTSILSTYHDHNDPENDYVASLSGTSMATPMAAGVAALIWSQNPTWTADQVEQHLYDTSDDIYGVAGNEAYAGKLGAGRINAFNAVNNGGGPVAPSADFTADVTSGCAPQAVQFTDQSSGDVDSWSWDFGDGGTSTAQNPSHTYNAAGTYTVSLTVTGPGGSDTETKTDYITVGDGAITADFSGTPTSGDAPLEVTFTDASTGDVANWDWDFGDGNSSTAQNPTHTYNAAGTYSVTLTSSNSCGSDSETKTDYITVNEPPCDTPVADFSGTPTSGDAPLEVSFTDNSTNSPTSWDWDFGDGGSSTAQNPTHIYNTAGTYTVTMTATNSCGSDTETKTDYITVNEPPCDPPVAAFTGSPQSGSAPLDVSFTDNSSNSPTSWDWDFGDGGSSTAQNPTHTYNTAGTYTVTMTATNSCGSDTETKTDYITVTEPASNEMHVQYVDVTKQTRYVISRGQAQVKIVDAADNPVASATVNGKWSGSVNTSVTITTNSDGIATSTSSFVYGSGDFTFCVENVTKTDYTYNPSANVETCGSTDGTAAEQIAGDVSIEDIEGELGFRLAENTPNPFNPTTTISFMLPEQAQVKVEIFNVLGQRVNTLLNEQVEGGVRSVVWNGKNAHGGAVSSGFYIYQITVDNKHVLRKKILMLK